MKLKYKLILMFMLLIVISSVPLALYILRSQEQERINAILDTGRKESRLLARAGFKLFLLNGGDILLSRMDCTEMLNIFFSMKKDEFLFGEVMLLSSNKNFNGLMLASSAGKLFNKKNITKDKRITEKELAGMAGRTGVRERRIDTIRGTCYEFIATDTRDTAKAHTLCRMVYSKNALLAPVKRMEYLSYAAIAAAVIIACLLGVIFSRSLTGPIMQIVQGTEIIGNGDLSHRIAVQSGDEIGFLSHKFNTMTESLLESTSLLDCILQSMPSALIALSGDSSIILWNSLAGLYFGLEQGDVAGKNLFMCFPQFIPYEADCTEVMKTHVPQSRFYERFRELPSEYFDIHFFPITLHGENNLVIRIDPVTEKLQKESQLRQAQKMEMIGNLAGGIAHDFNNLLAAILGTTSLLRHRIHKNRCDMPMVLDNLSNIEEAGESAADLVRQILSLANSRDAVEYENVNIVFSIKRVQKICSKTFNKTVTVKADITQQHCYVHGNATQIEQVLLNLCINAYHAMTLMKEDQEQGGQLDISLEQVSVDKYMAEKYPQAHEIPYWAVRVEDEGVGIETGNVEKIFDPFFTTKKKGTGTGLGLSVVYNIVSQHGGFIDVMSNPGIGSCFTIFLPVRGKRDDTVCQSCDENIIHGDASVLIIDDDVPVRNITEKMLLECGYRVYAVKDGLEGLKYLRTRECDVDVVVLDLIIPGIHGKTLVREIKKINQSLRIVITSGIYNRELVASLIDAGADLFLRKPYTLQSLSVSLNTIMS
ncbi:MAG TPA: ATP-binding protein [Spirochaetota bacterium]|nr:ATP-binding protein [Spirochaetota bacterium]